MESLDLRSHGLCVSVLLHSLNGLTRGERAKRADGNSHSATAAELGEISKELACEDEKFGRTATQPERSCRACVQHTGGQTGRQAALNWPARWQK